MVKAFLSSVNSSKSKFWPFLATVLLQTSSFLFFVMLSYRTVKKCPLNLLYQYSADFHFIGVCGIGLLKLGKYIQFFNTFCYIFITFWNVLKLLHNNSSYIIILYEGESLNTKTYLKTYKSGFTYSFDYKNVCFSYYHALN